MPKDTSGEDAAAWQARSSLAGCVIITAQKLVSAAPSSHHSCYDVWRSVVSAEESSYVVNAVAVFGNQLRRLVSQIEAIPFLGRDTKDFSLEPVNGMLASVTIPALSTPWRQYERYFSGEYISRLGVIRDMLLHTSPVGAPTPAGLVALKKAIAEVKSSLECIDFLPADIYAQLQERVKDLEQTLNTADICGGELVRSAATKLVGEVAFVLRVDADRAPESKERDLLDRLAKSVISVLDVAGRISVINDATNFAVKHAEKILPLL